ncbi:MAG: hypothetical protein JO051_14515 [Acidobacteriaceae bacterium]|nr:hypothetical protein [Acidobacteriaceae bacterium]
MILLLDQDLTNLLCESKLPELLALSYPRAIIADRLVFVVSRIAASPSLARRCGPAEPQGGLRRLLSGIESTPRPPLRPQMLINAVSDLITDDAVISLDCGANTHFDGHETRYRIRRLPQWVL